MSDKTEVSEKMEIITSKAGELTVLKTWRAFKYNQIKTLCRVICYCGNIFETNLPSIKNGDTSSCGCYHLKKTTERFYKHGHVRWDKNLKKSGLTPTYTSWAYLKGVCLNKKFPLYQNYGGRGITVCEEWLKFENFLHDMGEKPDGFRFKRIDNDGNFEPGNCEWVHIKKKDVGKKQLKNTH